MNKACLIMALLCMFVLAGCDELTTGLGSHQVPAPITVEVLAFTSQRCYGCQQDKPSIEQLRRQGWNITEVDADRHPEILKRYGVELLPTYIVLRDGIEVKRTGNIHSIMEWP